MRFTEIVVLLGSICIGVDAVRHHDPIDTWELMFAVYAIVVLAHDVMRWHNEAGGS